jgi:hypothetical protein
MPIIAQYSIYIQRMFMSALPLELLPLELLP